MKRVAPSTIRSLALACAMAIALTLAPARLLADDLPESNRLRVLPAGAKELTAAAKAAKPGDVLIIRGRIAESTDAFADGRAEFILVDDAAAASVHGEIDGAITDRCPLEPANRATVRIVDAKGTPLAYSVKDRSGLVPGAEVFVKGKVIAAGTDTTPVTIDATSLHIPRAGLPAGFLLPTTPESAPDVADAKKGLKKGDKVVIKGRIGGSKEPFVKERAVFTIVGRTLKACNEIPGDKCKFPWDYCCDPRDQILANSATIQVVDAKGAPLRTDIKGRWDIKELSEVIIVGTVAEAKGQMLIVSATGIQVVKP